MTDNLIIRQICLDIETTGINRLEAHYIGHNIIEIGAIEIINRKKTGNVFHKYIKPNRKIDAEAIKVHGISDEFLKNKPKFSKIANEFINFIKNSELIIHNAPFDIGFINYELSLLKMNFQKIENICKIYDTLNLAKKLFPGKKNSLDALCDRYSIDKSKRILHGALLDANLLFKVFLSLTGGQKKLNLFKLNKKQSLINTEKNYENKFNNLFILRANSKEVIEHKNKLNLIEKKSKKTSIWRSLEKE